MKRKSRLPGLIEANDDCSQKHIVVKGEIIDVDHPNFLQFRANRRNALLTKGPNDTSLSRFNAIKHGLRAENNVIPGERADEFNDFRDRLYVSLNVDVEDIKEVQFGDVIIHNLWLLKRARGFATNLIMEYCDIDKFRYKEMLMAEGLGKIQNYETHYARQINAYWQLLAACQKVKLSDESETTVPVTVKQGTVVSESMEMENVNVKEQDSKIIRFGGSRLP